MIVEIGERIKQARRLRGISQRALAERVGLSAMAISKYEQGKVTPSSSVLLRLARALDVRVEFFIRPVLIKEIAPAFRKRSGLRIKEENALLASIQDWLERYLEIERILQLEVPKFTYPEGFPYRVVTEEDVEAAALALREAWKLGLDPIENMVQLLEDKGIKIGLVEASGNFDACTFLANVDGNIPVIVVRKGIPGDRMRFNIAHELGHLLLEAQEGLSSEKAAYRFAGAFLVPEPAVRFELGNRRRVLDLYELHLLKHKYGLSMQAWLYRAKDLGILSKSEFQALNRIFRARGWHRKEPGDAYPPERPTRFERLVTQALAEEIISERKAAELWGQSVEEFRQKVAKEHGGLEVGLRYR